MFAVAALGWCAQARVAAQSSSSQPTTPPPSQGADAQNAPSGTYISVDPLANVRYNNRFDASLGFAYDHMKAGPNLLQGSNLGGLDISADAWLTRNLGIEVTSRDYVGTSGAAPNDLNLKGPFVAQYFFAGGPEWLGPHNKHGALIPHVLVGGVYGEFQHDLLGQPPSLVGFYNDQIALAAIMGGHFDLNRSEHWVFRVTPDAMLTHYSINYGNKMSQTDINFAISVGLEYKFTKWRR